VPGGFLVGGVKACAGVPARRDLLPRASMLRMWEWTEARGAGNVEVVGGWTFPVGNVLETGMRAVLYERALPQALRTASDSF
jgi:hypothetical protein